MGVIQINIQNNLEDEHLKWLEKSWTALAQNSNIPIEETNKLRVSIFKRYTQNTRSYHNLNHIYNFLHLSQSFLKDIKNPVAFNWGIWFHDLIYNPIRKDNEKRSADLGVRLLSPYLESDILNNIHQLIISTANHQPTDQSFESALFLDIDLAVLASPEKSYRKYSNKVRQEFWMIPLFMYRRGRAKVLQHFLDKNHIFHTDLFRTKFEHIARKNLLEELESLK